MKAKAKYGQATRLASTTDLPREQWLAIRKLGIGSSDAAVAVGLSPYRCPLSLWLEKTGRKEPDDISHKEAVLWGIELEPVLAQVYAKRTGNRVRRVNAVLQHPEHLFMLANLDREVVGHPDGPGILEIKTASYHSAPQWEEGVPVAYQCQVLHQLAVTGHAWAEVAVLIGGQDFRIYRIERDEEKIRDLTEREAQFWHQVTSDQQPEPDGSKDAGSALAWLFPRDDGETVDLSDSPEFNQLFEELLHLREHKEEVELRESQIKQRLQATLGEATAGLFADGKITWKRSKDRLAPDLDRLGQDHPDLLSHYVKPVPGSRRFTIQAVHAVRRHTP
ncbi:MULTISPECIES: YqaJ viral recombinase family nuclease [Aeromonas]|nr:YqaJ viral recombinase family protein [Aeromonas caviae]AXB03276.1 YqaJ viral recombinase family protein [Aeromonas caviae]MBL0539352.1 YqaJ viral recombinase family protein [Aeromonas caviae]MCK2071458.1 endonuclease [Aeromonas caviae]MDH0434790.1 YqaJ viral recombinase family protein [Aeromonas caviae]MDH0937637.1 YqaJ viral recombinase family protein [Aeromonas caviae]